MTSLSITYSYCDVIHLPNKLKKLVHGNIRRFHGWFSLSLMHLFLEEVSARRACVCVRVCVYGGGDAFSLCVHFDLFTVY